MFSSTPNYNLASASLATQPMQIPIFHATAAYNRKR